MSQGLFVGLITLDLVYLSDHAPANNQKMVASDYTIAAGGPATNAAVTFRHLGSQATILGALGAHPITHLILSDLQTYGLTVADLAPTRADPPPVSSIIVTEATGDRAVVSINAINAQASIASIPANCLQNIDVVLIDGHQMAVGREIAKQASHRIPVVLDGGSWKPGLEAVLPFVDYAICSENFCPPNCQTFEEAVNYLFDFGIAHVAMTQGDQPIRYWSATQAGQIPIVPTKVVDTLGAGDIFHGAFCHYILRSSFVDALTDAAKVAAKSCQFFGTRSWMDC